MLCPSERYNETCRERHKKMTVWARQMLCQLRRWLPGRKLVVVGDSSFAAIELLAAAGAYVTMVTRLRLDAALYAPAPSRPPGQPGRPRKKGQRLPKLEDFRSWKTYCPILLRSGKNWRLLGGTTMQQNALK